jgi:hypothetical protein
VNETVCTQNFSYNSLQQNMAGGESDHTQDTRPPGGVL